MSGRRAAIKDPAADGERAARLDNAIAAEHYAIQDAAAELGQVHRCGPLATIEIPDGEGFDHAGEKHFGFWTVPGYGNGSDFFRRLATAIVETLNEKRGTNLRFNVNDSGTQAIIHGAAS